MKEVLICKKHRYWGELFETCQYCAEEEDEYVENNWGDCNE